MNSTDQANRLWQRINNSRVLKVWDFFFGKPKPKALNSCHENHSERKNQEEEQK